MKKKIRYFVLIFFILIILCAVLAVKDTRKKKIVSSQKNITVVQKAEHVDVDNPRIFEMDDILYSENGDIYMDFQSPEYNYYSTNFDGTAMAVTSEKKLYYVDGKLEPVYLSESKTRAIISKKANFVLYNDMDELQCGCVYDGSAGRKIPIHSRNIPLYDSAISSNGRYVAFFDNEQGAVIKDVQDTDSYTIVSKKKLKAVHISPDGERGFFELYDDQTHFVFSYHDGELIEVTRGGYFDYIVNDECTECFVYDNDATYYYDIHMETGKKILDEDLFTVHCANDPIGIDGKYSSIKIADVETFRGCILDTIQAAYYFYSPYKNPLELGDFGTYDHLGFENGVAQRLYRDVEEYLCIDTMEDGCVTSSRLEDIDTKVRTFDVADNLSKIYYVDRDCNIWLYENGESKLLYDRSGYCTYIHYDRFSGRLFFIDNDSLYSVGEDPEDCRLEYSEADYISSYYYDYEDFLVFSYNMQKRYARIFGNTMLISN